MAKITYMPSAADFDSVEVAGITFKAYEPTEVSDLNGDLIAKLKRNPWFTGDQIDTDRHDSWAKVRAAQQQVQEHRSAADQIESSFA